MKLGRTKMYFRRDGYKTLSYTISKNKEWLAHLSSYLCTLEPLTIL